MKYKKIVLLTRGCDLAVFLYNGLKDKFPISHVVLEQPISRQAFVERRIRKIGYVKTWGMMLFNFIIRPMLEKTSKKRIQEIKTCYSLDETPFPRDKIIHVPSVNSKEFIQFLQENTPDLIVVICCRIISKKVLTCVDTTFVNTHLGISPKYRGVHGGYWALANRDKENCGVTVHIIDAGLDTGPVLYQRNIAPIAKDNYVTYIYLQIGEGIQLMKKVLDDFLEGKLMEKESQTSESKLWYHPTIWFYLFTRFTKGVK